ncbi:MAG TPA: hypothetical protein VGE04_10895 [Chloroflexia bacterium]
MGKVIMTITCDWEGRTIKDEDLQAMFIFNQFLKDAGGSGSRPLPITHFICPAYFTRTYVEGERTNAAEKIAKSGAIKPGDEVGLHIHCWKSLALEAGILSSDFQLAPVGNNPIAPPGFIRKNPEGGPDIVEVQDAGETVALGIYSQAQIQLYLGTGIALLKKYLAADTVSYRTGMWVTCDAIFSALETTPLKYEASGLPFNFANFRYATTKTKIPAYEWNGKIWGNALNGPEPAYLRNTQSFAQYGTGILGVMDPQISQPKAVGTRIEIPDTGALVPAINSALMNKHIDTAFKLADEQNMTVCVCIGFHQESGGNPAFFATTEYPLTPAEKKSRMNGVQDSVIHALSQAIYKNIPVEFLTIQEVGALVGM